MAEKETTQLNIHQKILKIADAAGVLQKSKEGFNYKYVPEEMIQAKVTAGMQKYGVMLYHGIVPGTFTAEPITYQKTKYDKAKKCDVTINITEVICKAETWYEWVNVENPDERVRIPWVMVGQMDDASQAFGAAETYCNRYFLMKSLQLATTEADPDKYRSEQKKAAGYEDDKVEQEKKEQEEKALKQAVKEVVDAGSKLISSGVSKADVMNAVGKCNNGDKNPSDIKSLDICAAVMNEFKKLKPKETKPAKE